MDINILNDEYWMNLAFKEAEKAYEHDEVPIGAIIVKGNDILGKGHNLTEKLQDPTAHAEMIAITAASEKLGSRRLLDCTLYVTLEPCIMCAGAIVLARIPNIVFGAHDPKGGGVNSLYKICGDTRLNHQVHVSSGVLENKCAIILSDFFKTIRNNN